MKTRPVVGLMAHLHYTGPVQGQGLGRRLGTMGFYIALHTVHTTQGIIVFCCTRPGPVQCISHEITHTLAPLIHL